jgi:hypothetical protein
LDAGKKLAKKILGRGSYDRAREFYWLLWDLWYGVETSRPVRLNSVNVVGQNLSHAVNYGPGTIRKILDELALDYRQYGFVDFGSGKGKVLMEAAGYPFRSVEGVEFSPEIHKIAEANIRRYRGRRRCSGIVRSVLKDATAFELPPIPLVLYFFHPFVGPVLTSVVENIRHSAATHPREIFVICAGELMIKDEFDRLPGAEVLWRRKYHTVYRLPG